MAPQNPLLEAALSYAALGWPVIPLHTPTAAGRCSCNRDECRQIGKHPRTLNGLKNASTNIEVVTKWWSTWPDANVAVVTGARAGFVAVDVDPKDRGDETLTELEIQHGKLPDTVESITGSGGRHILLKYHPGIPNSVKRLGPGLDTRGEGGYIVVAPSLHASGRHYEWEASSEPGLVELAPVPEWLVAALAQHAPAAASAATTPANVNQGDALRRATAWMAKREPAVEGQGGDNHTFWTAANLVNDFGLEPGQAWSLLVDWNKTCVPPWDERGLRSKLDSAVKNGKHAKGSKESRPRPGRPEPPPPSDDDLPAPELVGSGDPPPPATGDAPPEFKPKYEGTDSGFAERLFDAHGERLRYAPQLGYLAYRDGVWTRDPEGLVPGRYVLELARAIKPEEYMWPGIEDEKREKQEKWVRAVKIQREANHAIEAAVRSFRRIPGVEVHPAAFDANPMLLNVRNGTLDLRTGRFREHSPADLCRRQASVEYVEDARCPRWLRFLEEVQPDIDVRRYLQAHAGYCLTGLTTVHVILVFLGLGRNGKGTYTKVLRALFGDSLKTGYSASIPASMLLEQKFEQHESQYTRFLGARFATATEPKEGRPFDVSKLKKLSGGDPIETAYKGRDQFAFEPSHKLIIESNLPPALDETGPAIRARLRVVPWPKSWKEDDHNDVDTRPLQNPNLAEELLKEAPGILNWMLEGLGIWRENGKRLPYCREVESATEELFNELDPLRLFIEECCLRDGRVPIDEFFGAYRLWCIANDIDPPTSKIDVGRKLTRARFLPDKRNGNGRARVGLSLKPETPRVVQPDPGWKSGADRRAGPDG